MPVADHAVHPSTQVGAGHRYGCHSLPRPVAGAAVFGSPAYGSQRWPFMNTTDCQFDLSVTDPACSGCPWCDDVAFIQALD